jgi:uncharacterized membrane protein/mono/diheme cytochrome c family protein
MNQNLIIVSGALVVTICFGPLAAPAAAGTRDLAAEVRAVFTEKCSGCHGPNLAKPQGRFGYILDLARVASNREMVVPSYPEESELWELVRRGEMPPEESPAGPLSVEEKETIHAWIAAGAPAESPVVAATDPPETTSASSSSSQMPSILCRVGPFHVVAVHFPIALLIAAALAEFGSLFRAGRTPLSAVRFCVWLGASSAAITALLGWIHAANGNGSHESQILSLHRWIGTSAAAWAVGTIVLSEWDQRHGTRSLWFRIWLFLGAVLVATAGYFGGTLVHGESFLLGG